MSSRGRVSWLGHKGSGLNIWVNYSSVVVRSEIESRDPAWMALGAAHLSNQ